MGTSQGELCRCSKHCALQDCRFPLKYQKVTVQEQNYVPGKDAWERMNKSLKTQTLITAITKLYSIRKKNPTGSKFYNIDDFYCIINFVI